MNRRPLIVLATSALLLFSSSAALADPPIVGATTQADPANPGASASATLPTNTTTPVAQITSSDPIGTTTNVGAATGGPSGVSNTTVTGPGTSVGAPIRASKGSGDPNTGTPSTSPTATSHAAAPVDSSGTALDTRDQTLALRTSGTNAGGAVNDPTSADMTAAFCFLAHANEANGTPTANVSSMCGNDASVAGGTASSNTVPAGTGNGGAGASACVVGNANGSMPATASVTSACNSSTPSTLGSGANGAGSEGTTITPEMRASTCAAAQASAQTSNTVAFSTVCGTPSGATANPIGAADRSDVSASTATEVGSTGTTSEGGTTVDRSGTIFGTGIQLLPSTSTVGGLTLGGLMIFGAGAALLLIKRRKTI